MVLISGGEPLLNPRVGADRRAAARTGTEAVAADLGTVTRQARRAAWRACSMRSRCRWTAPTRRPMPRSAVSTPSTRCARGSARSRHAARRSSVRVTVQRANYRQLPQFVALARELGAHQMSFLAVDVANPHAFGRVGGLQQRVSRWRPRICRCSPGSCAGLERELRRRLPLRLHRRESAQAAAHPAVLSPPSAASARTRRCAVTCSSTRPCIGATGQVSPCFFIPGPPRRGGAAISAQRSTRPR